MNKAQPRTGIIDRTLLDLKREFPYIDETVKGIVYSVFFLANHFTQTGARVLEDFDLSWGDYLVLSTIRRRGSRGTMSPSAISDSIGMSTGGLSNLLRRLEKNGLITRKPSTRDGRGIQVEITTRGRKIAEQSLRAISENQLAHLESLPEADRAHLYALLRAFVAYFEAEAVGVSLFKNLR